MTENRFNRLVEIMDKLRSPSGCPWDIEQNHKTLIPFLLEESYEVIDVINSGDNSGLKEELGDLLLQVVFHAQIAKENNNFNINDVIDGVSDKLIRRHPHVFGDAVINTAEEQEKSWASLKKNEGRSSVLEGVPRSMPALAFAKRIQQRASTKGFDWNKAEEVWAKVEEEISELKEQIEEKNADRTEEEFGDLLFALVNYGRFIDVDAENALKKASDKFISRFTKLEKAMEDKSLSMNEMTLEELDKEWEKIKKTES
ncbi:nucleoside triphosphate pyrophosphohydrolase [bacterium]|nr:nucleoside triphosphate pyrophosphohydrolase [bacterium]